MAQNISNEAVARFREKMRADGDINIQGAEQELPDDSLRKLISILADHMGVDPEERLTGNTERT